jgi:hypothetical protein
VTEQHPSKTGKVLLLLLLIGVTLFLTLSKAITSAWGNEGWFIPAHHPEVYLLGGAIVVGFELVWLVRTLRRD